MNNQQPIQQAISNEAIEISDMPQIEKLDFHVLEKNYAKLCVIHTLITFLFFLIPMLIINLFVLEKLMPSYLFFILSVFFILIAIYSFYAAKACGYILREKDILYKNGLWWKKRTGVSFKRIQHIDITHGPIERNLRLATIKFFTAGGYTADLKISGLSKNYAEKIRSLVLDKIAHQKDIEN